ncbi:hypothetical protein [Nocardia sp. NPDC059239]|uniref:hypothetical protein n=1 Tax=Actinomycetes TaxID=1760 RepID=UPI0036AB54C5
MVFWFTYLPMNFGDIHEEMLVSPACSVDSECVNDVIVTRYGRLDMILAVIVRHCVEVVGSSVLTDLDSAHAELDRSTKRSHGSTATSPSQRWQNLMAELFGSEHNQLLEPVPDRDAALRCAYGAAGNAQSVTANLLAVVGLFLVSEADTVSRYADQLSDTAGQRQDDLEKLADRVVTVSMTFDAQIDDGTWPELYQRSPARREPQALPTNRQRRTRPWLRHGPTSHATTHDDFSRRSEATSTQRIGVAEPDPAEPELSGVRVALIVSLTALPVSVVTIVAPATLRVTLIALIVITVIAAGGLLFTANRFPQTFQSLTALWHR